MPASTIRPTLWLTAFAGAVTAACSGGAGETVGEIEEVRVEGAAADSAALPAPELARARETATALGQDLAGLVLATLEREGPAAAVRVCSDVAQERTAAHGTAGVHVRRVSDRLRNPLNAPDPAEARELERMRALVLAGQTPSDVVRVVSSGTERTLHLLRPIRIQPPCLTCHGDPAAIPVEVRQALDERYPEDRAVGYRPGDLRGAISVRVPVRNGER